MSEHRIESWQHDHLFGQDEKHGAEVRTRIVIGITCLMMVVEIAAGIAFGSMALLADGMHMASHVVALGISAFAYAYARNHSHDERFSFGTGKVNALGGFTGSILLGVFALVMAWESVERILNPVAIAFNQALIVAVVGLVINGVSALILGDHHHDHHHRGHDHHHHGDHAHDHSHDQDHNLRAAYFHVLADALTSLTAIVALLVGKRFGLVWMDPVMGIAGSILVARWALGLMKQSSSALLDHQSAPLAERVRTEIESDESTSVADLHVWSVAPGKYSAIISVVSESPASPSVYKERLGAIPELVHVTAEVNTDRS